MIMKPILNEILYTFLDKICLKYSTWYDFDMCAYKTMKYHGYHVDFIEEIKSYYKKGYTKKRLNVDNISFTAMANAIRQICHTNNIPFSSNKIHGNACCYNHYIIGMVKN